MIKLPSINAIKKWAHMPVVTLDNDDVVIVLVDGLYHYFTRYQTAVEFGYQLTMFSSVDLSLLED